MTTIDLVYFNAGGGHRAAALALAAAIREQSRPWQVRLVNLTEVLDPRGLFKKYTGMAPEDYYNKRLARGWTLGLAQELKLLQGTIRLAHSALVRPLQRHWLATEPDLVVSLIPNFNRALYESLASTLPGVPYVTVLTDIADHPPNFWIEPAQDQHFVCGSARAVEQAQALGYGRERVHRVSGMILRPDFYRQPPRDRAAERMALGLEADRPTGLVLFGGHGARTMLDIAHQLDDLQLILLCGHNRALAAALRKLPARAPRVVVEFTPEVPRYMQLADYFIGKPGPGSLSEAIHIGLPVITVRNAWTMPQEHYNTDWVREQGLGLVHKSFGSLRPVVLQLVERLEEFRANVRRIDNRAVWEVPGILAAILAQAEAPAQPPPQPVCA
ncbi:MAG: galactosyldiacylglycerol synthase [Burkholderiales bacterium]|jgi:UDP-N-acetylglucosamine:LPS N-acetylglucosamine transferase|nr:galactosyldiacylglycerol synthase [Burkholderiales bacterium]